MSEFLDSDYTSLLFNVQAVKSNEDYRDIFPELHLNTEFSLKLPSDIDRNMVIRYIIYCYDKNSPHRSRYKDLLTRKVHAAMDAGFELDAGKFNKHVEDILHCRNIQTNEMIIAYCKLHNSLGYRHLVLMENLYCNRERDVMLNQSSIKIKELQEVREGFDEAYKSFVAEENSKGLVKSLYESMNREKIALSPEDIAIAIKEKGYDNALV